MKLYNEITCPDGESMTAAAIACKGATREAVTRDTEEKSKLMEILSYIIV